MKKTFKGLLCALAALAITLLAAGCMNTNRDTTAPSASPMPSASAVASALPTDAAMSTGAPQSGTAASAYDWAGGAESVETRVGQFSELSECRIVVCNNMALVGVKFADQYKGELTERLHDMISGEIKAADPQVQTVAVTAEKDDVDKIYDLSDKIRGGTPVSELEQEIDSIARSSTSMQ